MFHPGTMEVNPSENVLRVAYARNPPDAFPNCLHFPQLSPTIACPFPGWCVEIMSQLAAYLKVKIEVVVSQNVVGSINWGSLQNDTWIGVLGFLANNTADTVCLMYQRTDLRDAYFDFSFPVTNVQPIYVVRRRTANFGSVLWNAFKVPNALPPYSTVTWIVILASFFVQAIVLVGISKVEAKLGFRNRFRPWEVFWQCAQLQLDEHSEDMAFSTLSGNIVMFFFALLQSGLLIYLYEGLLLTALIAPTDADPFKDANGLIQLIGKGEYHLVTNYMGNWYFDNLRNSNFSHYASLRAATARNPVVLADNVSHALDLVEQGNYVYPVQEDSLAMQMSKERCNFVYVSQGLPQVSSYFVLQNASRFANGFNKAIVMNLGFIMRTFRKYFREGFKIAKIPKCDTKEFDIVSAAKPLDLSSIFGVFMLGAIGLAFSLVIFFVEIYIFLHNRVLDRQRQSRAAMVRHLVTLARVHFVKDNGGLDVVQLVDIVDRKKQDNDPIDNQ